MAVRRLTNDAQARIPKDSWFLALMAVDPDFSRLGIGRRLLRAFEEEGCRRGFAHATLYVRDSNRGARALYEKSGWFIASEPQSGRILYTKTLRGGVQAQRS
jgi:ribosomal protein S18 acetylase RimI-like enzyme